LLVVSPNLVKESQNPTRGCSAVRKRGGRGPRKKKKRRGSKGPYSSSGDLSRVWGKWKKKKAGIIANLTKGR